MENVEEMALEMATHKPLFKLDQNNMNEEDGLYLSRSWKPIILSLKVRRNPSAQGVSCPNCPQDNSGPPH
jgi:hypothetical protein